MDLASMSKPESAANMAQLLCAIVPFGRFSMQDWLLGASITNVHGQVRNIGHGRVVLAMFDPATALRNPQWRNEFIRAIQILPRLMARAIKANEAAMRGDVLPAGVPHPGTLIITPSVCRAPKLSRRQTIRSTTRMAHNPTSYNAAPACFQATTTCFM